MRTALLTVCIEDNPSDTWVETYQENDGSTRGLKTSTTDVHAWAQGLIDYYNDTLRPGEQRRKLLSVEVQDDGTVTAPKPLEHDWTKTSLVTEYARGQYFDRMRCRACGITGKRHGVSHIKLDAPWDRAKKWLRCSGKQVSK